MKKILLITGLISCALHGGAAARADALRDSEWTFAQGRIRNVALPDLCLGVQGIDNHGAGARVEVYWCNASAQDPLWDASWYFEYSGEYILVKNRLHGYCLGVVNIDDHRAGAETEVYRCNPGGDDPGMDNRWIKEELGGGRFHLKNAVSGLCLGVVGFDDGRAGAEAEISYCSN